MIKLSPSVFSYSHDSWSKLLAFYESAIAADMVVEVPVAPTPVVEEDEDAPV